MAPWAAGVGCVARFGSGSFHRRTTPQLGPADADTNPRYPSLFQRRRGRWRVESDAADAVADQTPAKCDARCSSTGAFAQPANGNSRVWRRWVWSAGSCESASDGDPGAVPRAAPAALVGENASSNNSRSPGQMKPSRNDLVGHSRSAQQNDPRPPDQTVRQGARDCHGAKLLDFLRGQQHRRLGSSHRHRHLHCSLEGAHIETSKARLTPII